MNVLNNFRFQLLNLFIVVCFGARMEAQLTIPATPFAFFQTLKTAQIISVTELEPINITEQLARDSAEGVVNRYSIAVAKNIDIKQDSNIRQNVGDGKIWRQKFHCVGAYSLAIHFKHFYIPDGALLFVYNSTFKEYYGAFSSLNNKESGNFSIADFPGNEIIVEYYEPENANFSGNLEIASISAAYKDLNLIAASNQDVVCPQWQNWREQSNSVARMTFVENDTGYYCTGNLINNVRNDGTPYFLTANHCISSNIVANTLVLYFNFEASTCGGNAANPTKTISGSTIKAMSSASDFTLLELSEIPPITYFPYYAGWDASGQNPGISTCIHHPGGRQKVAISSAYPPSTYNQIITWEKNVKSIAGTHWAAYFRNSNIVPGSSGSALFDSNHRIIGQLHGGDNSTSFFGKLSKSWTGGTTASSRLDIWLDPDKTGTLILDGLNKYQIPLSDFSAAPLKTCISAPVQFTDKSKLNPEKWRWIISPASYRFINGTDSSTQNPQIEFLDSTLYSISLLTSNKNGTDTLTIKNFIDASSKINVSFQKFTPGLSVCAYDLNNKPLVAEGAINYKFMISPANRIDTVTSSNKLFLSVNKTAFNAGSFDAKIKVTGNQGVCSSSDSISIRINIPINDSISNALPLKLGENGPYSNKCATAELNEPQPAVLGCEMEKSWCYDTIGKSAIQNSLWFEFKAPSNGVLTIDARGFDSQLCIYQANSIDDLFSGNRNNYQLVAANDNRSGVDTDPLIRNVLLNPGNLYYLQLDGNKGAFGTTLLTLYNNSLEAFPNPSSGNFSIIISTSINDDCYFEIYSPTGQLVKNTKYNVNQQNNKFDIDLSNKSSGLYSLVARIGSNVFTRKILIVRPSHQ